VRRHSTSTVAEPRVTCEELADVLGWSTGAVITKCATLRIKVEPDWADRPSLSLEDAARAFERCVGDTRAHDQTWKSYQQYLADREERRTQAISQAAAEARKGIGGTPAQESAATRARIQAANRFEEEHPLIDFASWRPGGEGA
jgi:hypothetical protein